MLDLKLGVSAAGGVPERLHQVYLMMKQFCRERSIQLHMSDLTKILVGYSKESDFPCGNLALVFQLNILVD